MSTIYLITGTQGPGKTTYAKKLAEAESLHVQFHYVDAELETRKQQIVERNSNQKETFAFTVTAEMFQFMEQQWEALSDAEKSIALFVE